MWFGGNLEDNTLKWTEPFDDFNWTAAKPKTDRPNILLRKEIKNSELGPQRANDLVHEFSTKLSNAYGLEQARCYNHDGSFNFSLFSHYLR